MALLWVAKPFSSPHIISATYYVKHTGNKSMERCIKQHCFSKNLVLLTLLAHHLGFLRIVKPFCKVTLERYNVSKPLTKVKMERFWPSNAGMTQAKFTLILSSKQSEIFRLLTHGLVTVLVSSEGTVCGSLCLHHRTANK